MVISVKAAASGDAFLRVKVRHYLPYPKILNVHHCFLRPKSMNPARDLHPRALNPSDPARKLASVLACDNFMPLCHTGNPARKLSHMVRHTFLRHAMLLSRDLTGSQADEMQGTEDRVLIVYTSIGQDIYLGMWLCGPAPFLVQGTGLDASDETGARLPIFSHQW